MSPGRPDDRYERLTRRRVERFRSRYEERGADDCWIWGGGLGSDGYGRLCLGRCGAGRQVMTGSHRIAWMLANGPIPTGMYICHKCDVRLCVNPSHLFIGTHADNMRDCKEKGRNTWPSGERVRTAKLTAAKVVEMRRLRASGLTYTDIGRTFGVHKNTARNACTGISWDPHLGPDGRWRGAAVLLKKSTDETDSSP